MDVTDSKRLAAKITVSVIIPVCNGGTAFVQCMRAILRGYTQPDEIIVAANGCHDRSIEVAQMAGATIIEFTHPVGPAAARNAAARKAHYDILFFIDSDVAIHPHALDRALACFKANPDIAACFGSYDDNPLEKNFFSQYKNLFHHFIHQQARSHATTFWAGCGAIRRDVFEKMNGFDEAYRQPSIEDIELGHRLTTNGYSIRLDKKLLATHLKKWSLTSVVKTDIFGRALPWARLIMQSRSLPDDLNTKKRYQLSTLLVGLLVGLLTLGLVTGVAFGLALLVAIVILGLNMDWYRFAQQRKGWLWTILAIAWHWIYYLYSGAVFAYVVLERHTSAQTGKDR